MVLGQYRSSTAESEVVGRLLKFVCERKCSLFERSTPIEANELGLYITHSIILLDLQFHSFAVFVDQ